MRKVAMTLLTFALGAAFAVFFLNGKDAVEGQAQPAAATGGAGIRKAKDPTANRRTNAAERPRRTRPKNTKLRLRMLVRQSTYATQDKSVK